MKIIPSTIALSLLAGALFIGDDARAAADRYSSFFTIKSIETDGDSYMIFPENLPNDAVNDPANCVPSGIPIVGAYRLTSARVAAGAPRELIAKTILSAFMAGRKIKLYLAGADCVGSGAWPAYSGVQLDRVM